MRYARVKHRPNSDEFGFFVNRIQLLVDEFDAKRYIAAKSIEH